MILETFSLTENSKKVYVTLFPAGEQRLGQLIERLKMDRSSVYLAVNQLKLAGLVEIDATKRPRTVRTIEPRQILGRIETKIQSLEEVFDITHSNLAQLNAAYGAKSSRPIMQSFSGRDGLQQITEDILSYKDQELLLFTNQSAEAEVFSKQYHDFFIRKRRQQNLVIRVLATDDDIARSLQANDAHNLRRTKIITGKAPFSCEVYVYAHKVAMLSFKDEIIGFIINSPDYADLVRWQFNALWESI
jgi:sugar-specific transcriptional regulator TrmB